MADLIPFKPPAPKERVCSFCKTPENKCKKFVAGFSHNICGVCVKQCQQRIKESEPCEQ